MPKTARNGFHATGLRGVRMPIERHISSITIAGLRPRTIHCRGRILRSFQASVPCRDVLQADRADVEAYLGRRLSTSSRATYLAHLRSFYRWALDMELVDADPTAKVRRPKVLPGVPRPISTGDLAHAVDHAPPVMRAWLLLMSLAGLRCLEVSALRPGDLGDLDGVPMLFLRECKGGGTATVPAHPAIVEALAVLPIRNTAWWEITPNTMSTYVSTYLRSVGVDATAHQLRHTAGTSWYKASDHDLLTTARLLRHANVNTTQVYAAIDPERPAAVVRLVPVPGRPPQAVAS